MISLIVNGDDFGASHAVNQAIITAHQNGILQSASLMVTGEAFPEAVAFAKENSELEVGLHLVFLMEKSVLPYSEIPLIVGRNGFFPKNPVSAGMKWFFNPQSRKEIRLEIEAQIKRYLDTGLPLTHINGHLHFHTHPVIFDLLVEVSAKYGNIPIRVPRERLLPNLSLNSNNLCAQLLHSAIFHFLSQRCEIILNRRGISFCNGVIGFLETGKITEEYLINLIPTLTSGCYELYTHPGSQNINKLFDETETLCSIKLQTVLTQYKINLTSWQKLSESKTI